MANQFIKYFEDSFRENWDLPAMTNYETKQTYTYKDVAREIAKLHILFRELNIQQDDKIALVGNNTPEWAIAFLATITYGAVIVPILHEFSADEIKNIIEHSESTLLFIDDLRWNRIGKINVANLRAVFDLESFQCKSQAQNESVHIIMRNLPSLFKECYVNGFGKDGVRYANKDDQEMCVLSYTSGTTGFSKGAMLTGDNFCCVLEYAKELNYGAKGHKVLSILPLAHLYGCVYDFYLPMKVGGCITFMGETPSSQILVKALRDVQPDWFSTVPMVIELMYTIHIKPEVNKFHNRLFLRIPFLSKILYRKICNKLIQSFGGNLRKLFIAGAPLNKEVECFLYKIHFPFVVAYGMTECSPLISGNYKDVMLRSVGKPITGVSVKIDLTSTTDNVGEILVKGRNVMKGYFHNSDANRQVFTEDGWLRTGDLGMIDKKGNLFIKGRCKSMILTSSGQNVYPEEIEARLNGSPFIKESVVVQRGEKIIALVVPESISCDDNDEIIAQEIKAINEQLPTYSYIHSYEIMNTEFERTPKNSLRRYLYR